MSKHHPDVIAAAKAVYELRRKTAYGVGVPLGPWDGEPNAFHEEIIAEVKAVLKLALEAPVTDGMRIEGCKHTVSTYAADGAYRAMAAKRLKELEID